MTQVIPGKSRVRETRTPGSVRAKAEWLSYSTIPGTPKRNDYALLRAVCHHFVTAYRGVSNGSDLLVKNEANSICAAA
jgi:hypothetical protein